MAVLITGGAGFIGAAVAQELIARGEAVVLVDNLNDYYSTALKRARLAHLQGGPRHPLFLEVDFSDHEGLVRALADHPIDAIVHMGAQAGVRYSIDHPFAYAASNLAGHLSLLEFARARGVRHMVYASSSSVYGNSATVPFSVADRSDHPISLYAATKRADELMSETYAHLYRIPLTGLRFFTVYGPWGRPDMMVWRCTERVLAGEPVPVFNNGEMFRDFTYIDDIVAGVLAALEAPPSDDGLAKPGGSIAPHAIYNIGNNRPEHLMRLIELIERACGRRAIIDFQPMQPGDVERTYADIDPIARALGYRPTTSIDVGIPAFVEWYRGYTG